MIYAVFSLKYFYSFLLISVFSFFQFPDRPSQNFYPELISPRSDFYPISLSQPRDNVFVCSFIYLSVFFGGGVGWGVYTIQELVNRSL